MSSKRAIPTRRTRTSADFRSEALHRLEDQFEGEEFDPDSEPIITPLLKQCPGGIPRIIEALRMHDDPDAEKFIDLYDSLSRKDQQYLSMEDIAHGCGIGALRLAEIAQTAMYVYGQAVAKFILADGMGRVVTAAVKAATDEMPILDGQGVMVGRTNGDVKAMELVGRMSGLVPIPKGAQILIPINVAPPKELDDSPATPAWIDAGQRLRNLHDAVGPLRLPSPPSEPVGVGSRLDQMQRSAAEVLVDRIEEE